MNLSKGTIALVALAASTSAFAGNTLTFQSLTYGSSTDTAAFNGGGYYAGPFNVSLNGGPTIQTFCADINTETIFNSPTPVKLVDTLTMGAAYQTAAQLYNQYAPTVGTDRLQNAGLQVAIWETLNPTVTFSNLWQSGVVEQASYDISNLNSSTSKEATYYCFNGANQAQIGAHQAVPEPTSIAALGLGLVGLVRRRRNKKA